MRKIALFIVASLTLSANATQEKDSIDGRFYRLFMPFTFYHNVAGSQLKLDSERTDAVSREVTNTLMYVYLNRPDLVAGTETEMKRAGGLRQDLDKPIKQTVSITDEADLPLPDEPVADQAEVVVEKPNFWKFKGDGMLQFMQNYVSDNWYKGGESNYSAVGGVTVEANYDNKSKWKWDNKLEMKLGFQTSPSDTVHKFKTNEDLIRLTSKIGLLAAKNWYYTLQMQAQTQFARGLKANNEKTFSDFMSPFDLNVGLGMDYKVSFFNNTLTGTINLSALAINYRYVDRSALAKSFGIKVDDGHEHSKTDFGSQLTANLEWKMNKIVTYKTRLFAFTSYHRTLIEWENTFNLRVSKYISANLFLFPRFDDSNYKYDDDGELMSFWQFKEYCTLGFSYNF